MRRAVAYCWAIVLLCGACSTGPDTTTVAPAATASRPPSGAGTERVFSDGDRREWIARQRRYAWTLLESVAALPFPSKPGPWHDALETFARGGASEFAVNSSGDRSTRALLLFDPAERQSVPAPSFPLYEATFYNPSAYEHIRREGLYQDGAAARLVAQKRREIPEFPDRSMVLKTFWRPIPKSTAAERRAWVGIWKWREKHDPDNAGTVDEEGWANVTGRKPECVVEREPADGCVIANQHFVTARAADVSRLRCVQQPKCPENVEADQTLILLAFHVADKSLPDWFWATFWWKGPANERTNGEEWTCDNAQRPPSLNSGVWSYYSLDVGPSFILFKPPILDVQKCGTPGKIGNLDPSEEYFATYNPFVEGVVPRGRKSSCLDCHARASSATKDRRNSIPLVDESISDYPDLRQFESHARTDYMWTLPRYIGTTPEPSPKP